MYSLVKGEGRSRRDIDSYLKTKNFNYTAFKIYDTNMEILLVRRVRHLLGIFVNFLKNPILRLRLKNIAYSVCVRLSYFISGIRF